MIENIKFSDKTLAIIIKANYQNNGVQFFTPPAFSQQLAYMCHPKGHEIKPHLHNVVIRQVEYTQEVLVIKTGKLRVDFYNDKQDYLESRILETGDVILLASGGHGFEVLENLEMFEIKQGPYLAEEDKVRFNTVIKENIKMQPAEKVES